MNSSDWILGRCWNSRAAFFKNSTIIEWEAIDILISFFDYSEGSVQ